VADARTDSAGKTMLSDDDFLSLVAAERRQSVGFEEDSVLLAERELALNYYKGDMTDVPSLPNRSRAVSTDVADAIETVLPDLVEIFTGGDDVATFKANNGADEAQAQQETDYVNQVILHDNDGFLAFYTAFKDALQVKTGIFKFWWETTPIPPETFTGKTLVEAAVAAQDGEITDLVETGADPVTGERLFGFTLAGEDAAGMARIAAVPPEDFTVARDTVRLAETTYCAFRTRPRAQELIAQGIDPDVVEALPAYGLGLGQTLALARDTAGEHLDPAGGAGSHNLRTVEVVEHYVRVDADGSGQPRLWRVLTGGGEGVLIEKEPVDRLPFSALTPYIVPHRFYGQSVADLLIDIQRIRTALTRMLLDSGYFALNQRMEVASDGSNEWTISDLLRNEPNMPVRSKSGNAVRPLSAGALNFDVMGALEYTATMAEGRTGIVRNAQGLNPDTLHDTASGAMALMTAAQKRTRLIARIFAETGMKELFLGVHALLRKHADKAAVTKLRGTWTAVDPSQWAERTQMTIQLGLGSSGRVQEVAAMSQVLAIQQQVIKLQGGASGPLVTQQDVFNATKRLVEKLGERNPELFFSDPSQAPPPAPPPPPGPNTDLLKLQAHAAAEAQKSQNQQTHLQVTAQEAAGKLELERQRDLRDEAFRRDQLAVHAQLQREKLAHEREMRLSQINAGLQKTGLVEANKAQIAGQDRGADLLIQAAESQDVHLLAQGARRHEAAMAAMDRLGADDIGDGEP
jgi:hypothetical protein